MVKSAREDALPLDSSFYVLSTAESIFFKAETGIENDEDLRQHILAIQTEAYEIYPYPCIRRFDFNRLKISLHPKYDTFLRLGKEQGAIYLDIGCCFRNDVRKAVLDGYPASQVIASDLRQEFWDLGHRLFRSTPDTFPVPFLCGDIFEDDTLKICQPSETLTAVTIAPPILSDLGSLTPLQGHVTTIHAAALFHLFDEPSQLLLAQRLASLLSPAPGSMIFGSHVGRPVKGLRSEAAGLGALGASMFCHFDKSWVELWDGNVFPQGTVQVDVRLEDLVRVDLRAAKPGVSYYQLIWSVTRL